MNVREHVSLAPLTTLGVGGTARFFIEAQTEKEVEDAIVFARERAVPLLVLGAGSNVLVRDAGVDGVVLKMAIAHMHVSEDDGDLVIDAGAGVSWEDVVREASAQNIFGVENLAGIPGTLAGAVVQNIGAYGAEFSKVFSYAEVVESVTGVKSRIDHAQATFGYRTSFFKAHPELIITRVALCLATDAVPNLTYADIARVREDGVPLGTPSEIANAVRAIRGNKFPAAESGGSAGSFFKNPVIPEELAASLTKRFPGLPVFSQQDGTAKVSLAWILDRVLSLKGYAKGRVALYEKQPLVMVTEGDATAAEVDALACEVAARVYDATGITIEREVETFGAPESHT